MFLPVREHGWKRFAVPSGGAVRLVDEFLPDPEKEYTSYFNPSARALDTLRAEPLIVLLGDSGLGKSDTFRRETTAINEMRDAGHRAEYCRVSDYVDTQQIQVLFGSPSIRSWIEGSSVLTLFVDGLDEGLLRGDEWRTTIRLQLQSWSEPIKHPDGSQHRLIDRLCLRISCRPGLWPDAFGKELSEIFWPEKKERERVLIWELAPLRENDVEMAAQDFGFSPSEFLKEVEAAGAQAFAASPLSLRLLFEIKAKENRLPKTRFEMFRKGCAYLAEEHNVRRRESAFRPRVTAERRMTIARRLAAMCVFSGKLRIARTAASRGTDDPITLNASAARGSSLAEDVTVEELEETLDSSLFSFEDDATVRWAHSSFATFLAAEWCVNLQLPIHDLRDLVFVISGSESGVPDQIWSTAGWICELYPPLQRLMVRHGPSLLLSLHEGTVALSVRPSAVKAIVEGNVTPEISRQLIQSGAHLKYPEIATQLKPYVISTRKTINQRRLAIDLCTACKLTDLSSELAKLALNRAEPLVLRRAAAYAISQFGDRSSRVALLPLALEEEVGDAQDLKGWALAANWPGALSAERVFALLTAKKDPHFHGGYDSFLYSFSRLLGEKFTDEDLFPALAWAHTTPVLGHNFVFDRLIRSIIMRACKSASNPPVRRALAELLVYRARGHGEPVPRETSSQANIWEGEQKSSNLRHLLFGECLEVICSPERATLFRIGQFFRLSVDDIPFLTGLIGQDEPLFAAMVAELFTMLGLHTEVCMALFDGVAKGLFAPRFLEYLKVERDSEMALYEKESHQASARRELERATQTERSWNVFRSALKLNTNGGDRGWPNLWEALWNADSEKQDHWNGSPNLERAPGWSSLDDPTKDNVRQVARSYATTQRPMATDFLGGGEFPTKLVWIYASVLLSIQIFSDELRSVDDAIWSFWTVLAFWYPFSQDDAAWRRFVDMLQRKRPDAFLDGVRQVVLVSLEKGQTLPVSLRRLQQWPPTTEAFILQLLERPALSADQWSSLVEWGMESFPDRFVHLASDQVKNFVVFEKDSKDRCAKAVTLLLLNGTRDPWREIESVFATCPEVGTEALSRFYDDPSQAGFLGRMSDVSLGTFYVWLRRNLRASEMVYPRGGAVNSDFHVRMLTDRTFSSMVDRGNATVFRYVEQAFPEDTWMQFYRETVMRVALRKAWKPLTTEWVVEREKQQMVPWFQTAPAFIGAFLLAGFLSVAIGELFNSSGPRWLNWVSGGFVGLVLGCAYFFFIRARQRSLKNQKT